MKILVYGIGGAGGYFGAKLAKAGYEVTMIARGKHLAAIREFVGAEYILLEVL